MATIRPNDHAPEETVKYILPAATFELSRGGEYETTNRTVLADAEAHPWLEVEYPQLEEFAVEAPDPHVPADQDPFRAENSQVDTEESLKAAAEAQQAREVAPVAVEAGLDQGEEVTVGDTAVTVAAADVAEPTENPRKSGGKKE